MVKRPGEDGEGWHGSGLGLTSRTLQLHQTKDKGATLCAHSGWSKPSPALYFTTGISKFFSFLFFFFASFLTQWRWFFLVFGKKTPAQEEGGLQERRQEARGGWNVGTFTDQQQEQGEPPGNPPTPLHPQLGLWERKQAVSHLLFKLPGLEFKADKRLPSYLCYSFTLKKGAS